MTTTAAEPQSRLLRVAFRGVAAIERAGNRLPNPFWLFWLFAGGVAVLSAVLAALHVRAVNPATHKVVEVASLLSRDGFTLVVADAVESFASFPPLATILTVMLGIGVAERSGLLSTMLRRMVARVPAKYLTFALSMTAMVSHVVGDAADRRCGRWPRRCRCWCRCSCWSESTPRPLRPSTASPTPSPTASPR